jgi:anti-anti-sigma regulatory factor
LDPVRAETASLEELFKYTVDLIPRAFRDSEAIGARTRIADRSFLTENFRETEWVLTQDIVVRGQTVGAVEVHCREEASLTEGGPFSKGKRHFLEILAARLGELVRRGLSEDAQLRNLANFEELTRIIERQRAAHKEISTPVLEVWDKVLMVPIAGIMDSQMLMDLMDKLLSAISSKRARFVIIDLTGVLVVDTGTADHLIRLAQGVSILGASCIFTGIRTDVARTILMLGVDLSSVKTLPSVEDGLRECLRQMGGARVAGMIWASLFRM